MLMVLTFVPHAHGGYFDNFACGQPAPAAAGLQLEYTDIPRLLSWYRGANQRQDFGGVISDRVSYLFLNGQFYGKLCPIVGQDHINAVLRFFRQELERIHAEKPDAGAFRHPIERRDDSWVFVEPDVIVIVRRFSVHLGQVEILCRDLYERHMDPDSPTVNAVDP
jgi:hypothetical protein